MDLVEIAVASIGLTLLLFGLGASIAGIFHGAKALWCPTHLHASFWPRKRYQASKTFSRHWRFTRRFVIRQHIALAVQVCFFLILFPAPRPPANLSILAAVVGLAVIVDAWQFLRKPDREFMLARRDLDLRRV